MLTLLGCNHRSAPVEIRERLAFAPEELRPTLERLVTLEHVDEAVILSTCNRVEVLVRGDGASRPGVELLRRFLEREKGLTADALQRHAYHYTGLRAVRHLFEVAAGLDSMILGEPQILGQVKQAYLAAKHAGTIGTVLEHLFQHCLASAKRIRNQTGISRNAVSVAYAAVNLARQIFGDLAGRKALLLGSGKMMQLVARHFGSYGVSDIAVASRTYNHAETLARQCDGHAVHWDDGLARLHDVDIIVTCTAAPRTILGREQVERARRRRRGVPLFIIDIAVPRDVDPAVNELDNVYLYDIDGLQEVVDSNRKQRERAAERARQQVKTEVAAFDRWRQSLEITPTIVMLRSTFAQLADHEVARFRSRLGPLSPDQQGVVEELVQALVNKILHRPVRHLRKSVERGDVDASASLYREIFGLDAGGETGPDSAAPARRSPGPSRLLKGGKDG